MCFEELMFSPNLKSRLGLLDEAILDYEIYNACS